MKNTILYLNAFILTFLSVNNTLQASTVDLSNCNAQSSFAIVSQSEGPTYACGGIDTGVGNPINVLNGNKFEEVEDFKAPPAYEGLSFSRYYNSHSKVATPMGYGWYSSFDIKLYEQPDIIQVRLETGKRINFVKTKISMQNQGYVVRGLAQNPKDGWVEKRIDGSGWIWHKDLESYYFEASSKDSQLAHLVQVRNEKESIYTLRYDVNGRLTHVENARGDALNWQYKLTKYGLPQITVSTPLGTYEYFLDQNQNLVQVVYPNGKRLKYSYEPAYQSGNKHSLTGKWILEGKYWKKLSEWHYDANNRAILSTHDKKAEQITISYDTRFKQDKANQYGVFVNTLKNSLGEKTQYTYQISGTQFQLIEVLGFGCSSCQTLNKKYHYNHQGLVDYVGELNQEGLVTQSIHLKYDEHGNIISKTLNSNQTQPQTTTYVYETYTLKTAYLDQVSNQRLVQEIRQSVVDGKKYIKSYGYNNKNQLILIKQEGFTPFGEAILKTEHYDYNQAGQIIVRSLSVGELNYTTHYFYNADGQLERMSSPEDRHIDVLKYDALKRPIHVEIKDGTRKIELLLTYHLNSQRITQYQYVIDGKIKHIIKNQYNKFDQLISTSNDQVKSEYTFDEQGHILTAKNQHLEIQNTYNSNLELLKKTIRTPLGEQLNQINFHIDANHQIMSDQLGLINDQRIHSSTITYEDALHRKHIKTYDDIGRIIKDQKMQRITNYSYQKGAALQQSSGLHQQKYMDDFGRTVIDESSTHGIKIIKHNALDLPVQIIDENGLIENYRYDADGRLMQVSFKKPNESEEYITQKNEYDGTKRVKQIGQHEVQTWQYFNDGKLKKHDTYSHENINFFKDNTLQQPHINHISESYEYNALGLLHKEQRHDLNLEYSYNTHQQVAQIKVSKQNQTLIVDDITWNAYQQMTHYRLSTGQQMWRKYNARGRLVQQIWLNSQQSQKFQVSNYIYDLANRLIYSDEQGAKYYQYDEQDQLTAVWQKTGTEKDKKAWQPVLVYAYDTQGNRRLRWKKNKQQDTLNHYNYQNNQLIGVTSHQVQGKTIETGHIDQLTAYNNTGQPFILWKKPTQIYTLAQYLMSANTDAPVWLLKNGQWRSPEQSIQQTFNLQGLISSRSVTFTPKHRFSQSYHYTQNIRTQERDQFDFEKTRFSVSRDYIFLDGVPVAQYSEAVKNEQVLENSFNPIRFNHVGAPIEVLDEVGVSQWSTAYSPFGERENTKDGHSQEALISRAQDNLPITQTLNHLRFAPSLRLPGQYEDPTTGLYDNGYRQYDPQIGRYLSPDPLGTVDGLNPYLYVGNNPLNKVDPLGLYQTDMHYYMTYFLAITAGIDPDRARRIALAAQFVDTNDYTSPYDDEKSALTNGIRDASTNRLNYYHFVNYQLNIYATETNKTNYDLIQPKEMKDEDYSSWRVTSNLEAIPQLSALRRNYEEAQRCNNENLSMQFFGEYLHVFGDTFSHRDQNNVPYSKNSGLGHGLAGSNPDYTFNHYAEQSVKNVKGKGSWGFNESRTLSAEEQIYNKLLEYRRNVLKQPDTKNPVIPWETLKFYLAEYNKKKEHLEPETDVGSLDSVKTKIQYLQDLLNGGKNTGWNFNKEFKLILNSDEVKNKQGRKQNITKGFVADVDGYRIADALKNRIEVLKDLTVQDKNKYKNVIWDTGISSDFEAHDGEHDISKELKKYKLQEVKKLGSNNSKAFTVQGYAPTDVIAGKRK